MCMFIFHVRLARSRKSNPHGADSAKVSPLDFTFKNFTNILRLHIISVSYR